MIKKVIYTIVVCSIICCNNNKKSSNKVTSIKKMHPLKVEFEQHFKILDSASKVSIHEKVSCCMYSIKFMEENTHIDASSDGTYLGKLFFLKEDLKKWHEWYEKNNQ